MTATLYKHTPTQIWEAIASYVQSYIAGVYVTTCSNDGKNEMLMYGKNMTHTGGWNFGVTITSDEIF